MKKFGGGKPSGGKGGGKWMFVPPQMMAMPQMFFKGGGKGKVMDKKAADKKKTIERLQKVDVSCKVWVGGLSKKVTWKMLEKHFEEAVAKPAVTDVSETKGTGVVAFKTAEDAATAIATLNGSELGGKPIEVDAWEKGTFEKTDKPKVSGAQKRKNKQAGGKPVQTTKGKKSKVDPAVSEKLKSIDSSCKVWVGGLADKTTSKGLEKHFEENYGKPSVCEITRKGKACVAYETEQDAETAIITLNATELDGNTIETDAWVKPEKKEKAEP